MAHIDPGQRVSLNTSSWMSNLLLAIAQLRLFSEMPACTPLYLLLCDLLDIPNVFDVLEVDPRHVDCSHVYL